MKKNSDEGAGWMAIGGGMREDQGEDEELEEDRTEEVREATLDNNGRVMKVLVAVVTAHTVWQSFEAANVRARAMNRRISGLQMGIRTLLR